MIEAYTIIEIKCLEEDNMRIDMHVHVTPPDIIKDYIKIGQKEPYFNILSSSKQNKFADATQVVAHMKEVGIDKSVVFGFSFQDMGLCQYVNDYVIEQVKRYPDELIGFAAVVPNHPQVAYEIQRCVSAGLKGIGEVFPAGQNFQIARYADTIEMATAAQYYQIPVIVHTNEPVGHDYVGKTNTPLQDLEAFVVHHPDLQVILAHWGGGIFIYELMKEVKEKFKNVYYDNAATVFLYDAQVYHIVKEMGLMDKVLFGSDYPLLSPQRYEVGMASSGLLKEDVEKLMGLNAARLLRL